MFKQLTILILSLSLIGCGAAHTAIKKKNLSVQTKMSSTIFLDPVEPEKRTVFLQIKNTSDKPGLSIAESVRNAVANKGYKLVNNPKQAQYMVQANVLQVGQSDLRDTNDALSGGYGSGLTGALAGGGIGAAASGHRDAVVGGALIGGAIGFLTDAMVKDVNYSIITDLQVSERAEDGVEVTESNHATLKQGTSGSKTMRSTKKHQWHRYQTRIVSTANKVNLKFEEALPQLVSGLTRSIAGIL